jgi:hypothetical protein
MTPRRDIEDDGLQLDPDQPVLLLTMRQVATLCQVSIHRVREWTLIPGFPVIRTPHMVRIHARLLDVWLAGQAQEPSQEKVA